MREITRFRSELFPVEPGEDEQTNPLCFGKALAHWLRDRFVDRGYSAAAVVAEDFGWCVMLEREPYLLWVGCASELDDGSDDGGADDGSDDGADDAGPAEPHPEGWVPDPEQVTWLCFAAAETPVWTAAFWKRLVGRTDPRGRAAELEAELAAVLAAEPGIRVEATG